MALWMSVSLYGQQVGDLYTFPDGSQGIVYYLLPDGSGGWVVALQDLPSTCYWGLSVSYSAFLAMNPLAQNHRTDTAGYKNTQFLRQLNFQGHDFGANLVDFEHGWYIPAAAQLSRLYSQLPYIESALSSYGNPLLDKNYWSSTPKTSDDAYFLYFGSDDQSAMGAYSGSFGNHLTCCYYGIETIYFRAVRTFTYPPVLIDTSLTYQWNTGSSQPAINPTPGQTATYTVTATNESGCSATASQTIFVAESPQQDFYDEICQGEPYEANGFSVTASESSTPGLITRTRTVIADGCSTTLTLHLTVLPAVTTTLSETACQTYVWNGVTLYETGTYEQHFPSANGCDSTVILHLTLLSPDTVHQTGSACNSYTLNGTTYTYSGTYTQHLTGGNGCDSVVILDLTIQPPQYTHLDTTVYNGLHWEGSDWNASGDYTVAYTDQNGCDSIVIIHLTVIQRDSTYVDSTVCSNKLPLIWNGVTFNGEGEETVTFHASESYDSVVVMSLHLKPVSTTHITQTVCDSLLWEGSTYTQSGDYTKTLTDQEGCDSIVVVHLVVNASDHTQTAQTSCDSYLWGDETITQSGVYTKTFTNRTGCDSVVTMTLTVNPSQTGSFDTAVCGTFFWNGQSYTESGDYSQTLANQYGCDSTVTIHLTVHNAVTVELDTLVCPQSLPVTVRGFTFAGAGTQTVTVPDIHGCDSTTTVHLSVSDTTTAVTAVTACNNYYWYGTVLTESGIYERAAVNQNGCPYTRRLNLTVHYSDTTALDSTVCQNTLPLVWNGRVFNSAGTQSRTFPNHHGCDSVVVMTVTVVGGGFSAFDTTVCEQFEWAGSVYTQSGAYMKQFTGSTGCDSMVIARVTVTQPPMTVFDTTVCVGDLPVLWRGQLFEHADTLTFSAVSASGCDSTAVFRLRTATPDTVVQTVDACDVYEWDGDEFYEDDTLVRVFSNIHGCDSVVTLYLTVHSSVTASFAATACGEYEWGGVAYTATGDYTRTFTNAAGCDSVVTMHLTVNTMASELVEATACDSYVWHGETYTESGDYDHVFTAANGCDSVVTLHLTLGHAETSEFAENACDEYVWNGETFTETGNYSRTFTNAAGCDSVVTLHLTIHASDSTSFSQAACDEYVWNGETFTETGDYTLTFTNAAGCDSVVTLHLTIHASDSTAFSQAACNEYSWNGVTYTASGDYFQSFTNTAGCDSVVTLHLIIRSSDTTAFSQAACNEYVWNGETFTETGDYTRTFTNAAGCDSVVTLHLTIHAPNTTDFSQTACNEYEWGGVTYTATGDYTRTFANTAGCDSVVTLHLTIRSSDTTAFSQTACNEYEWGGVTYTASGDYTRTFTNAAGCDSVVTMHLTIYQNASMLRDSSVCANALPLSWNGVTFNNAGTQSVTLQTVHGCDSVVTMVLHVLSTYHPTVEKTICQDELPYQWNGVTFSGAGTQVRNLQTVHGCDSVVTMVLHVSSIYQQTENREVCVNELPYLWNGVVFDSAGSQTVTLPTVGGCDSVVTMVLAVSDTSRTELYESACDEYSWDGIVYSASGTYTQLLTNGAGCDSVVVLHLTINPSVAEVVEATACNRYVWNGETYLESGEYESTFETAAGCDSVVTLHLTVIDTALQIVTLTEDFCEGMSAELVAVTGMTDYLWSTGEELPNITVTQPGLYSVTASQGGCRATAKYSVEACDFRLWLPNAITPSKSDGLNDVFALPPRIQGMVVDFEISIFNRWGEQVFYSTDKAFQWDGSVEGKRAVNAVFNYVIWCTVAGGRPYRFTGSVTVL